MNLVYQHTQISRTLKSFATVLIGVLMITFFAQISIPLNPVPITLQTVAVLFIGLTYTSSKALKVTVLYLILGFAGLPIFSSFGFGPLVIFGPKGGYILGFIPSAYLLAKLREKYNIEGWKHLIVLSTLSTGLLFLSGVTWLSYFYGFKNSISLGFLPFIIPAIIKIIILVSLLKTKNINI